MKVISFERQVKAAQRRLQTILIRANGSTTSSKALQDEAIAEFSIALEELHVATEELHAQNAALLANRQALELERQRYQELFDFAPDGYLVTDTQCVIQQANCAAAQLLNLRQDLVVGKPLIVFIANDDQSTFFTQLSELIHRGQALNDWEVTLQPREKPPLPVSISVSTIYYDPQGKLSGFRWLLRDLSQRKQNEQKLQEQANLLNVATDAILVCNLDNQILFWNQSAERLYGWTAAEALGKNVTGLLTEESLSVRTESSQDQVLQNGQWLGELAQVTQDNQEITVESHWTLVRDAAGEPKSILIVNTDITEKKQLEAQLFQSQRVESLGTLSRGIAHDLNNILTPILGISQLLPRKVSTTDPQTIRLMTMLETSAKRAIDLVKQIQLFAGGAEGERTILHLGTLIADLEELAEKIFPKSITFHTDIAPELWSIEGNSVQLHQVLINLCVNGRDAMPNGGTLSLSVKNWVIDATHLHIYPEAHLGPYVVLTIVDSGLGIPAEIMGRIFEPFFTTKEAGQASGLGLSIVAGILKNHDGFVVVSSRVGRGTQFQVFLPALMTMAISPEATLRLPRGNAECILVVDDEPTILETTQQLLENFGYQVLTAQDGIAAIALYQQHPDTISAVLMDMMMPSMDGEAAILGLKAINAQVKIIANSGLSLSHPSASSEVSTNINAFLPKPCSVDVLLTALREVLDNPAEAEVRSP